MIRAYVGDFGSGKTLNMVWDLILAMYRGRKVVSNTPIRGYFDPFLKKKKFVECEFIEKGDDFLKALAYKENCIFAIDEAAVYLPNIYWHKLPPELIVKFAQNRKYRTDFYYTTQGFGMAVKRLREITHRVYLCHPSRFLFWRTYTARLFKPEYFHGSYTKQKYERYYLRSRRLWPADYKRVFRLYNTNYVVDMSAMMKVKGFSQPKWYKENNKNDTDIYEKEQIDALDQTVREAYNNVTSNDT
jgi:hypothetical protein